MAVDGPGKARVRFNGLNPGTPTPSPAHEACRTGIPDDWDVPAELIGRLGTVTLT